MTSRANPTRFVFLGASNLTIGFPIVLNSLANTFVDPIDVFAAHGHGRSFGKWSYVLLRGLPGIRDCGLWNELNSQPPTRTCALITDVGNDLIYGSSVNVVFDWVSDCLVRLSQLDSEIVWVRPPLERVLQLRNWQYRIAKNVFFPGPTVPWEQMQQRIYELDQRLLRLAHEHHAKVLTPTRRWYGIDPIHIRWSQRIKAWQTILSAWDIDCDWKLSRVLPPKAISFWTRRPLVRTIGRRTVQQQQPHELFDRRIKLWQY